MYLSTITLKWWAIVRCYLMYSAIQCRTTPYLQQTPLNGTALCCMMSLWSEIAMNGWIANRTFLHSRDAGKSVGATGRRIFICLSTTKSWFWNISDTIIKADRRVESCMWTLSCAWTLGLPNSTNELFALPCTAGSKRRWWYMKRRNQSCRPTQLA